MGILTVQEVVEEAKSHYCVNEMEVAGGLPLKVEGEHNGDLRGHALTPPLLTLALASLEEEVEEEVGVVEDWYQLLPYYSLQA